MQGIKQKGQNIHWSAK